MPIVQPIIYCMAIAIIVIIIVQPFSVKDLQVVLKEKDIYTYYICIKMKSHLSVCPSAFVVMLLSQSSRHGSNQDLVCVIAMVSGTSKFAFTNY